MHHDEVAAKAAGQPSVFGHGMFSMGLLGSALTDYVGVGNVTRYQVRFARQTWPDEVLSTRIVVTGKREEDGERLVDLAVTLSNAEGEDKVVGRGHGVAALIWGRFAPSRSARRKDGGAMDLQGPGAGVRIDGGRAGRRDVRAAGRVHALRVVDGPRPGEPHRGWHDVLRGDGRDRPAARGR